MDKLTRKRNRAMVNGADKEAGIKTAELGKKWAAKENIIKKQAKSQRAKYMERLAKYQAKMEKKKKKAAEKKHKAAEKKHKLHSKELLDKSKVKKELRMKRAKHSEKERKEARRKKHMERRKKHRERAEKKAHVKEDYEERVKSLEEEDKKAQERSKEAKKMEKAWAKRAKRHRKQEAAWRKKHKERRQKDKAYIKKKKAYNKKERAGKDVVSKAKRNERAQKERRQKAKESKQKQDRAARHLGWISRLEKARADEKYDSEHAYLHSAAERLARSNLNRFVPGYNQQKEPIRADYKSGGDNEIASMPPPVKIKTLPVKKFKKLVPDKAIEKMPKRFSRTAEEADTRDEYKDSVSSGHGTTYKENSDSGLENTLNSKGKKLL